MPKPVKSPHIGPVRARRRAKQDGEEPGCAGAGEREQFFEQPNHYEDRQRPTGSRGACRAAGDAGEAAGLCVVPLAGVGYWGSVDGVVFGSAVVVTGGRVGWWR